MSDAEPTRPDEPPTRAEIMGLITQISNALVAQLAAISTLVKETGSEQAAREVLASSEHLRSVIMDLKKFGMAEPSFALSIRGPYKPESPSTVRHMVTRPDADRRGIGDTFNEEGDGPADNENG